MRIGVVRPLPANALYLHGLSEEAEGGKNLRFRCTHPSESGQDEGQQANGEFSLRGYQSRPCVLEMRVKKIPYEREAPRACAPA